MLNNITAILNQNIPKINLNRMSKWFNANQLCNYVVNYYYY